jgi:hypothetical protein
MRADSDDPSGFANRDARRPSLSRYDFVLAVIPLALLVGAVGASVAPVPLHAALLGGAAVGVLALVDALFRNPPGRPPGDAGRPG